MVPSLSLWELIKIKFDEVQNIVMEQEKTMRMEMEKKSVEMEEEIQKLSREKAAVVKKMEKNRKECDDANQRVEELQRENQQLRAKMKMKMKEKEKMKMKEKEKESDEPRLSKDLPDFHENAGIGSSERGSKRLAHSVKTEDFSEPVAAARDNQGKEPEMRACSRASATCSGGDDHVIVLSDSSDDEAPDADYCVGEDSNSILDEQDSDNDSCSDSYINTLVEMLQSRKKRKKKDF